MKLSELNRVAAASRGAMMIVRNRYAARVADPKSPDHGKYPAHRASDGTPCTLTLLGHLSPEARRIDYERAAAAQSKLYQNAMLGSDAPVTTSITVEDIESQETADLDRVVRLTSGWHGYEGEDGEPLPFSRDAVRQLYEFDPDIRQQAIEFIASGADFFAAAVSPSPASSSIT